MTIYRLLSLAYLLLSFANFTNWMAETKLRALLAAAEFLRYPTLDF